MLNPTESKRTVTMTTERDALERDIVFPRECGISLV